MNSFRKWGWVGLLGAMTVWVGLAGDRANQARRPCFATQMGEFEGEMAFLAPGLWQLLRPTPSGPWGDPRVYWDGNPRWNGARVRIWGRMVCGKIYRNPDSGTGFGEWRVPRWSLRVKRAQKVGPGGSLPFGLARAPQLTQWARAVWLGRGEGLDPALWESARELGILPVLVQSGQHVMVLLVVLGSLGGLRWRRVLHGLVVGILLWLHPSLPVQRLAGVLGVRWLLRQRGLNVSAVQCIASTLALHLICSPHDLNRPGLLLSYVGAWGVVAGASVAVVVTPLLATYFGSVPLFALGAYALIGALWNGVGIPLGFVAPLLGPGILPWAESVWTTWTGWHLGWELPLWVVVRPGWISSVLGVALVLGMTGKKKIQNRRKRCTAITE